MAIKGHLPLRPWRDSPWRGLLIRFRRLRTDAPLRARALWTPSVTDKLHNFCDTMHCIETLQALGALATLILSPCAEQKGSVERL